MAGQYTLENYNANRVTDVGTQQISIRPYDEVTSLNVNQLLNDIATMGPQVLDVTFSAPSAGELQATVAPGFGAFFKDSIEHDLGTGDPQDRTYVVRVGFETSAAASFSLSVYGTASAANVFRTGDRGDAIGEPSPDNRRLFLVVRYSWEEGMLGSATATGGGSGAGNVGPFATLTFEQNAPHELAAQNPQLFSKTIYLGELLNLSEALTNDGSGNVIVSNASRIRLRSFARTYESLEAFTNLKKANSNFRVTFNPTGDYIYVNSGQAWIGSSYIKISDRLQHRERIITPLANLTSDPDVTPNIFESDLSYHPSTGEPLESGSPVADSSNIRGQYDVLVMDPSGEIGWVIRAFTSAEDAAFYEAQTFAANNAATIENRPLPQTPGWDSSLTSLYIGNTISKITANLIKPYLVLCVLRRLYYVDGSERKLRPNVWNTDGSEWLLYEHNPLFPILSVPDVTADFTVSDTLIIPVEEV